MDFVWLAPKFPFVKISVHCISSVEPLPNGNTNGVGVIISDHEGSMLWRAMGPMPGLSNLQALLWGVHAGMVEAMRLGKEKTLIEIDNRDIYMMRLEYKNMHSLIQTWRKQCTK